MPALPTWALWGNTSDPQKTKPAAVAPYKHSQRTRCTHILEIFSFWPLSRALCWFFSHASCYKGVGQHWQASSSSQPSWASPSPGGRSKFSLLLFFSSIINSGSHWEESTPVKGYRLSSSILHWLLRHNFLLFLFFLVSFPALRHRKITTALRHTPWAPCQLSCFTLSSSQPVLGSPESTREG